MLTTSVVLEVRRLLREGQISQRGIARHLGLSRGTVNAIALEGIGTMPCERME